METDYYKDVIFQSDCKERIKAMGIEYNHPLHPLNKSGVNGVSYRPNLKSWFATITIKGKRIDLGFFKEFEDAVKARLEAEDKYGTPKVNSLKEDKTKRSGTCIIDLSGREYPQFKVVKYIGNPGGREGPRCLWQCLCECGKTFVASSTQIRETCIVSCGCIEPPKKEINHKVHKTNLGYFVDGSCYTTIKNKEAHKNSRSGIKGVYQDKFGTWYAKLTFQGKAHIFRCDSKLDAIYKRKELELEYFDPYIKANEKKIEKKMKKGNK